MIWTKTITRKSKTNELLASEKWPILATFSQLEMDNSWPSFNMHHVTFRSSARDIKAQRMSFLHELTKRSIADISMRWATIRDFYAYYTHASISATISRWILSIILMLASRGSGINCRNSAIVLKELFPYWWVNRLLSRLILTLFIRTQKKYSGGWATTQSALPLTKPPGLRGLIVEIKRRDTRKSSS